MTEKLILALDQGTTSSRSILFNEKGETLSVSLRPIECLFPQPGRVEQSGYEILNSQKETMREVCQKAGKNFSQITAIGITNQRESVIAWHKETGEPVSPAINWQCRRTADFCEKLKKAGHAEKIRQKTGLVLDAYFSATKLRWILKEIPYARKLADEKKLLAGTIDSWLVYQLTGGKSFCTDVSNASRTMLYNIRTMEWDSELLDLFEIPVNILPKVVDSSGEFARTDAGIFGTEIPITGMAGDQQAATFGQVCFEPGEAKNTYGTGCFLLMNTGENLVDSKKGLLGTIGWRIGGKTTYALEGSIYIGGSLIQWLRDQLNLFKNAEETEKMALSVEDSGGVFLVPAFVGLGAPHWDSYARGSLSGLTHGSNKNHIVRAALEAIAFQSYDILKLMEEESKTPLKQLKVDGGASLNNFLCEFQADLTNTVLVRPFSIETTATGVAFLAGLGAGVWSSQEEIRSVWKSGRVFVPQNSEKARAMLPGWNRAIERSKNWLEPS